MSQDKAKAYWRHRIIASLLGLALLVSYLAILAFTGISGHIKAFSVSATHNFYISLSIYLAAIGLFYYLIALPLDFYSGYILEHKFSLSNQDFAAWLKDDLKRSAISGIITLLLFEAFYAVAINFQSNWWLVCSAIWVAFSVLFAKVFPIIIIPLFYKYNRLSSSELRAKVLELAGKFGIDVMDVFEIDFSKNTRKANAAVIGWGKTRRVILADNLINEFSPEEVEVVIAHEMAHLKSKHIWKLLAFGALWTSLSFLILRLTVHSLARALGASGPFDMAALPAIMLLFVIYGIIITPIQNGFSRKLERDADLACLKITGLKRSFISLMEKLALKNLSDTDPHRLIEIFFYDHPPIAKRIESAKTFEP